MKRLILVALVLSSVAVCAQNDKIKIDSAQAKAIALFYRDGTIPFDKPVVVIDGVMTGFGLDGKGDAVNPNDIETITVLKGLEATAVYGDIARYGSIRITLKKVKTAEELAQAKPFELSAITGLQNKPLFILDGVQTAPDFDLKNGIKPEDINSISVLKGQNAIDVYGEAGKNGVVIIKTKRGIFER